MVGTGVAETMLLRFAGGERDRKVTEVLGAADALDLGTMDSGVAVEEV